MGGRRDRHEPLALFQWLVGAFLQHGDDAKVVFLGRKRQKWPVGVKAIDEQHIEPATVGAP